MSIVLSVYGQQAFCQFLLPSINNSDHQIVLKQSIYGLSTEVSLKLEVLNNKWYLRPSDSYSVETISESGTDDISFGDVFNLRLTTGEQLSVIASESKGVFKIASKYDITNLQVISIGSDTQTNHIGYQNTYRNLVSKNHAEIKQIPNGHAVTDRSANGTFVNGKRISGTYALQYGDCINIFGLKIVYLGNIIAVTAYDEDSIFINPGIREYFRTNTANTRNPISRVKQFFHRSPRNYIKLDKNTIDIDPPPSPKEGDKRPVWMAIGPSFTMVLPMLLGSMMMIAGSRSSGNSSIFMFTGLVTAGGSAIVGVFWAINNMKYAKKTLEEEEARRFQAYSEYIIDKSDEIRREYDKYRTSMHTMYPSALDVSKYNRNSEGLWNRNLSHDDFLSYRLGTGEMDFPTVINVPKDKFSLVYDELSQKPSAIKKDYSVLYDIPITVDLLSKKLIGVVGGQNKKGAYDVIRILSSQIAACSCYTDVKLVYIYNSEKDSENWEYAKWFPHVWSEDKKVRYIATNKNEASDVFFELMQIFRRRVEEADGSYSKMDKTIPKPYYIMIVSDMDMLEGELIAKYMYSKDPSLGLTSIILTEGVEQLPNECTYVIQNDSRLRELHDLSNNDTQKLKFDTIDADSLEAFARRLMPIEVKEVEIGKDVPDGITFFEMYGAKSFRDFNVSERWLKNRNYENMKALIGVKGGGVPCYLDVHEKYHGPHGLVAGTTGSGKSETLQTYLLSLAINFSPDDVAFFLIDYKGGGMAGLFDNLPHLAGSISNLSGNQIRRAMISIKSENKRRQRLFNESGVNNINLYTKRYKYGEVSVPIPHLFIVIDEFAELKREEPEFMKELISVAQVGRSLGVHLILATQKPAGTVDDNIWSNSKFRLCLRVQDQQDSKDMLHKPDAAFITQAGRGYLQVGNDEVYEMFQSGYSGANYVDNAQDAADSIVSMISITGSESYVSAGERKKDNGKAITQLDAVINFLHDYSEENGYRQQARLWMPLLPKVMYLKDLAGYSDRQYNGNEWPENPKKFTLMTQIGMCDDPVNQAQMPYEIDFAEAGHIAVIGNIASGKSTFIQSLLYAIMCRYSPEMVNFYALDFSSQMLASLEGAPHTGGVVFENELEKINKFFYLFDQILAERKALLRGGNFSQFVQVNGYKVPAIIITIDNYGSFREKTGQKYDDKMLALAKEGVGYGIYLLLSASGVSSSEIPMKLADNIRTNICLNLNDKYAYSEVLRYGHLEVVPENNIKGRGLCLYNEVPLEFQTALSVIAEDDFSRGEVIKRVSANMNEVYKGKKARQIPVIPEKPLWADYEQLEEVIEMQKTDRYMAIGYDKVSAAIYGIDLSKIYTYIVGGRSRSGKTTMLKELARSAAMKRGKVVIIEHGSIELKTTATKVGAEYINSIEEQAEFFKNLVEPFKTRNAKKRDLIGRELDEAEIWEEMQSEEPIFIIISDMTSFIKSIYQQVEGVIAINGFIENIAEKGKLHNIYFFIGMNPDETGELITRKAYSCFTGYKTGIHLGGNIGSIRYFEYSNFNFKEQSAVFKPGTGMIPLGNDDTVKFVVLPNVKG